MITFVVLGVVVAAFGLAFDIRNWLAAKDDDTARPVAPTEPARPAAPTDTARPAAPTDTARSAPTPVVPTHGDGAPAPAAVATAAPLSPSPPRPAPVPPSPFVARPPAPPPASGAAGARDALFVTTGPVAPVTGAAPRSPAAPAPDDEPLLVCRGVHVAYDKVRVLFGVDMEVRPGEIVALLGTNGAGKSTLLKAISGLVDPVEGAIVFGGKDITHADPVERAGLGIVQVPGGRAVFPTLTVAEHFKAAAWLFAKEGAAEVQARTAKVLELFPRLGDRWHQMAGNLSGGEQQQLGLGMAFVAKPRLLIIDELSLGLAPAVVEQLLGIVRAIHGEGCPVILVEQSVNVALTVAHRAYFMEKGEVRFEGAAADLLSRGDLLRSVFLEGAAANGSGTPALRANGQAPASSGGADRLASQPVVLSTHGLTKRFGGIVAVDDVTLELRRGETLGLIGPNGAGKTTVLDLISGVLPADGGRIELDGVDVGTWSASRRARSGLGRSFQDARIFPSLTVRENIAMGLERHITTRDHLAAFLDLPAIQQSERQVAQRVEELIELMRLQSYQDKFVSELSTGVRRIVDLTMAIAHDPTVLLLDEPSSGVAQRETEALGPLLKDMQRATQCSIVIIEHDMPLISTVSDEIVALDLGRVVARGPASAVMSDPRVVASYLGEDVAVIQRSGRAPVAPVAVAPARHTLSTTTPRG
ncbi:MAG TPA: ATP-binding cassette domain-containing protein [Acidimicrobiales bacterium]|nr:ATP-binding cassette domain-containing protein [Acidimicrobiales bacterium]